MLPEKVKKGICLFTVTFFLFVLNAGILRAEDNVSVATTALNQGKYGDVVKYAGQIIAKPGQKPEVMAQALLLRGIAYRNQGKTAQAIADLSNAEWVRKLSNDEMRRLYAERALAYDAVGQKALADKDRSLAGSKNVVSARDNVLNQKQNIVKGGVRRTSVEAAPSATSEFFGGLGNLFGFNNKAEKKPEVAVVQPSAQVAVAPQQEIREIPTIDDKVATNAKVSVDAEAVANDAKLKASSLPSEKPAVDGVPSNSAWAARRADEMVANPNVSSSANNAPLALNNGQVSSGNGVTPIALSPKKTNAPKNNNVVSKFFDNIFGGTKKPEVVPVNPGDDVIVAEQVAAEPANTASVKAPAARKPVPRVKVAALEKKPAVKKPVVKKAAPAAESEPVRSFYHVQLGAFGEAQAADKFVSRLNGKFKSLVGNKTAMVVETDMGNSRRQYRVYLGPFRSKESSVKTCNTLTRLGMGCSLVK